MFHFHLLILLSLLSNLLAQETENAIKKGHSHNGHAFNEGPRQAGPLMGDTGEVHLPISTTWEQGQAYFDQGLGQLHGFWYYEAERSFRTILAHDPDCAMAYWGLSQANIENPKRAKEFTKKAAELIKKNHLKGHELAYLKAEIAFHDESEEKDSTKRRKKLLKAYENIILDYPHDIEAKALFVCRRWQFSYHNIPITSHIGMDAILEQIFDKKPTHPAHHYAIHLWDYRRHQQALDSAAKLGLTAPKIAHMWHMPGHIYAKAKRHHDVAWAQQASARIDHAHMQKWFLLPDQIHNYAHNNEWLSRTFLKLGKVRESILMAKSLLKNPRHPKLNNPSKGSARYGRQALLNTLEQAELWQEALDTAHSPWLEKLPKPQDDLSRLRLIGLAQYHLDKKTALKETTLTILKQLQQAKKDRNTEKEKAGKRAREEKKTDAEIKKAEKNALKKSKRTIKKFARTLAELRGYLAAMNQQFEQATEALKKRPEHLSPMRYQLAYGEQQKAAQSAKKEIKKNNKEALPLAKAIHTLYHAEKKDPAWEKAFQDLRAISSEIELTSPVFARLSPIAQELGYPKDWRLPHTPATDLLPRPSLNALGPLHWTPPPAPEFSLPDQTQINISLSDFRGKPLILIFYLGAGCLHCTEQLTAIAERHPELVNAQLPVLAISTDTVKDLKKSQENYTKGKIPFPLISDAPKEIFKKYTAHDDFEDQPLHGTFLIDHQGRILWSDISADPFMDIDFLIKESKRLLTLHK